MKSESEKVLIAAAGGGMMFIGGWAIGDYILGAQWQALGAGLMALIMGAYLILHARYNL